VVQEEQMVVQGQMVVQVVVELMVLVLVLEILHLQVHHKVIMVEQDKMELLLHKELVAELEQ